MTPTLSSRSKHPANSSSLWRISSGRQPLMRFPKRRSIGRFIERLPNARVHFPGLNELSCLIVIGSERNLSAEQKQALRKYNRQRHELRIVGFDWLSARATAVRTNTIRTGVRIHKDPYFRLCRWRSTPLAAIFAQFGSAFESWVAHSADRALCWFLIKVSSLRRDHRVVGCVEFWTPVVAARAEGPLLQGDLLASRSFKSSEMMSTISGGDDFKCSNGKAKGGSVDRPPGLP